MTRIVESLSCNEYFKSLVYDLIKTAEDKSLAYDCSNQLTLYHKYSRKDACKLLNWLNDESSTMYGYKPKHGTCPIFVTYHKNEEVESSVNYGDEFINQEVFTWYTRSNRTLDSQEVKKIINAVHLGVNLHLFVKKDDDEGTDFYYIGKAVPEENSEEQTTMLDKNGKELPVVRMNLLLEHEVEPSLYHYLIENK